MLSPALQHAVTDAQLALGQQEDAALPLAYRRAIWTAMGPTGRPTNVSLGDARRALQDMLVVQHVQGRWQDHYGTVSPITEMLNTTERVLRGELDHASAVRIADGFRQNYVEPATDEGAFTAVYVGEAAWRTVWTAMTGKSYEGVDATIDDHDLDSESWEPSFFGALAVAGELGCTKGAQARQTYWTWYLDEATPEAYTLGDEWLRDPIHSDEWQR